MKKIFSIIVVAMASCHVVKADLYDEIQVVPTTVQAETTATLNIRFDCPSAKDKVKYLQFTIEYPEGWKVGSAALCKERVSEYDPDFEEYGESRMTLSTTASGTQRKYIIYANTINDVMAGETGNLMTVKIQAPAGTPDGYYPVRILQENSYYCIDSDAAHNTVLGASTSYVKVGSPDAATIKMEGTIPSFVNEALAREKGIAKLDLTDVTASNGVFVYLVGRDVLAPKTEVTAQVKAVADAPAAPKQFSSIRLPFDADIKCYTLGEKKDNYVLLQATEQLDAGVSAVIDQAVESNVVVDVIREAQALTLESGAYLKNDNLFYVNGNARIPALRGYWMLPAGIKGFIFNDEETGINGTEGTATKKAVYNTAGQRKRKAERGINIVESRKFIENGK